MADLTSCQTCGHAVSSAAENCPKCGSRYPHGSLCKLCGRIASEGNSIPWVPPSWETVLPLFHRSCADRLLPKFRPNCVTCGFDLRAKGKDRYDVLWAQFTHSPSCPSCGEPSPVGVIHTCTSCGFALPPTDLGLQFTIQLTTASGTPYQYHKSCVPPPLPPPPGANTGCLSVFIPLIRFLG